MKLAIRDAIKKRNLLRLRELLDEAGDDIDLDALDDDDGHTLLSFASEHDNPEMVELLLARGARPDVKCHKYPPSPFVVTPLHIVSQAKRQFNPEIAQLLTRFGASVDPLDSHGHTPLQSAVGANNVDMVEFLLRQGADPLFQNPLRKYARPLIFLAIERYGNSNKGTVFRLIWRWIMERKKITFPVDSKGNTVLHIAAQSGAVGALYTMLRACVCQTGLSTSVLNSNLESPLAVALSFQNFEAARLILVYGGQPVVPSNPDPSHSPLLRAFRILFYDDGRSPPRLRQEQYEQLCQMFVDSGYPLGKEEWLNNDFDEVLLRLEKEVEFIDIMAFVPQELIDVARLSFESLKRQRLLPLKSLARLAIRRSVMENPCLRCRLDALEKPSLEGLMKSLNLPPQLHNFVTYQDY